MTKAGARTQRRTASSKFFAQDVFEKQYGFEGFVQSDCNAVYNMEGHENGPDGGKNGTYPNAPWV